MEDGIRLANKSPGDSTRMRNMKIRGVPDTGNENRFVLRYFNV